MYGAKGVGQAARDRGIGNLDTSFRSIQYSKNAFKTLYFASQVRFDVLCPLRKPSTCPLVTEPKETSPICREKAHSHPAPILKETPSTRFISTYRVMAPESFIRPRKDQERQSCLEIAYQLLRKVR